MEFKEFRDEFQKNFSILEMNASHLFEVDLGENGKEELYNLYLDSFPPEKNKIYRERREFDCSACKHFLRAFGNVVFIVDNKIKTIWDFQVDDSKYQVVIDALDEFIRSKTVSNVFITTDKKIGVDVNHELAEGYALTWYHLYLELPDKFVYDGPRSIDSVKSKLKSVRDVFERSLKELSAESVATVLDLISDNSLYKGAEWKKVLESFLTSKEIYDVIKDEDYIDNWLWVESLKAGPVVGKIRNHSMGTLLTDITEGMDLEQAVRRYESIVAPTNYKRPKAIFTQKMLEDAKKTVEGLGLLDSLPRRFANADDVSINDILYSDKDSAKRIEGSIFDEMAKDIPINPNQFKREEEISYKDFIANVLPRAKKIELFFENRLIPNLVSLIAPVNKNSPSILKWPNNHNWAYKDNIADSNMKELVKLAGGNVDGVMGFRLMWNDEEPDGNDLDAHCIEPGGNEIFYRNMKNHRTSGELDVDIIVPKSGVPAVENITWTNKDRMEEGVYKFFVRNFSHCGGRTGFKAQIEFDGQIFEFNYPKELKNKEDVHVADVTYSKANGFSIKINSAVDSTLTSKEVWGLTTNQFVPVTIICYSPNHWDEENSVGHKHVMFMVKDCVNSERPNGFYNEQLKRELEGEYKRVFEALGSRMAVQYVEDQLSGLGFSTTKHNSVLVKVTGQSERVLKVIF